MKEPSKHNYCSSTYGKFVNSRNNGGLISRSESSFKIILEAEKEVLYLTYYLTSLNIPNLNKKVLYKCYKKLSLAPNIFRKLDCNCSLLERPHTIILITLLINRYISIRLKSFNHVKLTLNQ